MNMIHTICNVDSQIRHCCKTITQYETRITVNIATDTQLNKYWWETTKSSHRNKTRQESHAVTRWWFFVDVPHRLHCLAGAQC